MDIGDYLADFPRMGRVVSEFNRWDVRQIVVENYRLLYFLTGDDVEIAKIIHGAQRLRASDFPL